MRSLITAQQKVKELYLFTFTLLLFIFLAPPAVLSHAGHGDEFHNESEASQSPAGIEVDAETAKRMGILVEPLKQEFLEVGIKATGQIETLPSQKVEVTSPIAGKIVQLLVEPGERVEFGETLAILSSPELVNLRVESLEKTAEAEAEIKEARANLDLSQQNYDRQVKITEAEIAQAKTQLAAAQEQYDRDRDLVGQRAVLSVAKENYQRQVEIAEAEIARANTELAIAQEQYDRDRDLVNSGALPRRQMLESQAHLAEAQAAVARANSRPEVLEAEADIKRAEVDLPFREMRESQAKLAEAKAQLTRANQRQEVLEAEAELNRAEAALSVAKSRLQLSKTIYQTRLNQLGTAANEDGTITIAAPISGVVSDREITPGQSVDAAGEHLMTIQDSSSVWATANIYEKDLAKVQTGQRVRVKVASLSTRTFTGRIILIGSAVEGETRVIPVKAELENFDGQLKPGMFAELEVLTDKTPTAVMTIPSSAVVQSNSQQLVYVQNGQNFQPVEVTLGRTAGDLIEVKNGLFEGDRVVIQGAIQLYAQSLRGGTKDKAGEAKHDAQKDAPNILKPYAIAQLPGWVILSAAGAIASGAFWVGRRTKPQLTSASHPHGSAELPASYVGEFADLSVEGESDRSHPHSSVAGRD